MNGPLGVVAAAGVLAVGTVVALVLLRRTLLTITVHGNSMSPTFADGDRLVVRRGGQGTVGDVVVFAHPAPVAGDPDMLVKRVAAVPGDPVPAAVRPVVDCPDVPRGQLVVLGDNAHSLDSRTLGFIAADDVVGVVRRRLGEAS